QKPGGRTERGEHPAWEQRAEMRGAHDELPSQESGRKAYQGDEHPPQHARPARQSMIDATQNRKGRKQDGREDDLPCTGGCPLKGEVLRSAVFRGGEKQRVAHRRGLEHDGANEKARQAASVSEQLREGRSSPRRRRSLRRTHLWSAGASDRLG